MRLLMTKLVVYSGSLLIPVKALLALTYSGIVISQIVPMPANPIDAAGRLSLDAALVIAVGVLWKALTNLAVKADIRVAEKDKQILDMTVKVTETMVSVMEAVKELRATVATISRNQ